MVIPPKQSQSPEYPTVTQGIPSSHTPLSKLDIVKRAMKEGRALLIELSRDRFVSEIPIQIVNDSIWFINDESHRKFLRRFDDFKVIDMSYSLEPPDNIQVNLDRIHKRASDRIISIEYWNDSLESIDDEELDMVSVYDDHIEVRNSDSHKSFRIRIPFIRYIEFEGQTRRELLERLDQPLAKYEGYKYYDTAIDIISSRTPVEVANSSDRNDVVKLLEKATQDESMSSNTRASAFRFLGELSQTQGDIESAVRYYSNALSLNPKVGVKFKLAKLQTCILPKQIDRSKIK